MERTVREIVLALMLVAACSAQQPKNTALFESTYAHQDVSLDTNPNTAFWKDGRPVYMQVDIQGRPVPEYRTEVRSRWTKKYVYFLFSCPYQQLYLKPNPDTARETYKLWDWNVAEVFIGTDFKNIKLYKEFEISPHGEWIDLDIDLSKPHHEEGWVWNSGFEHQARIDESKHVWYAAMRIPFAALGTADAKAGMTFRVNLFRTEGPPDHSKEILWQATMSQTFHVPERFGLMKLR
jgi:hypothetical protein